MANLKQKIQRTTMTNKINKKALKIFKTAKYDLEAKKWRMKPKNINKLVKEIELFVIHNFNDIDGKMLSYLTYTLTLGMLEQVQTELELYMG